MTPSRKSSCRRRWRIIPSAGGGTARRGVSRRRDGRSRSTPPPCAARTPSRPWFWAGRRTGTAHSRRSRRPSAAHSSRPNGGLAITRSQSSSSPSSTSFGSRILSLFSMRASGRPWSRMFILQMAPRAEVLLLTVKGQVARVAALVLHVVGALDEHAAGAGRGSQMRTRSVGGCSSTMSLTTMRGVQNSPPFLPASSANCSMRYSSARPRRSGFAIRRCAARTGRSAGGVSRARRGGFSRRRGSVRRRPGCRGARLQAQGPLRQGGASGVEHRVAVRRLFLDGGPPGSAQHEE